MSMLSNQDQYRCNQHIHEIKNHSISLLGIHIFVHFELVLKDKN